MMMKRSKAFVPATQTGDTATDGQGQSITWQNKGGRNATTEAARRAAGQLAPRPQNSKAALLGSSAHTAGTQAAMARVKAGPAGPPEGRFLPVQNNAMANQVSTSVGQPDATNFDPGGPGINMGKPITRTGVTNHPVATAKPKRKGLGSAFFGEY
jgi:Flp pilus assembly protein TadG